MNKAFKLLLILVSIPIFLMLALMLYIWVDMQIQRFFSGSKASEPVIGYLGGVTVAIPHAFARFVEYDTDPHFTKRTFWSSPQRTFQSRLRSFGFEVRYPDMASVEVRTAAEKDIYTTMWMRVGITSGEFYGVDDSLENHKKYSLDPKFTCLSEDHCYLYVPLPDKTYGLTGYTPTGSGVDLEARNIESGRGVDMRDRKIYFFKNDTGQVKTYIECSNMTHAAASCTHFFNLSPVMKAHIEVSYRKGLLSHWQQIQQLVTELLYSFEVNPDTFQQVTGNRPVKIDHNGKIVRAS